MLRRNAIWIAAALTTTLAAGCGPKTGTTTSAPSQPAGAQPTGPVAPGPAQPGPGPTMTADAQPKGDAGAPPSKPFEGSAEPLPSDSYASPTPPQPRVHVVQPQETLRSIAQHYYNDGQKWRRIYEANRQRIADPDKIRVGMKLIIP